MNVDITIPAQSVTIPSQDVAVSVSAAQIVYQNSWLNQTAAIPSTNIFTSATEGLFRVTAGCFAYGTGSFGVAGDLWYPSLGGTQFSSGNNGSGQENAAATFVFNPPLGVPVLLLSTMIGGAVTYYDLYVTIEQLQ